MLMCTCTIGTVKAWWAWEGRKVAGAHWAVIPSRTDTTPNLASDVGVGAGWTWRRDGTGCRTVVTLRTESTLGASTCKDITKRIQTQVEVTHILNRRGRCVSPV